MTRRGRASEDPPVRIDDVECTHATERAIHCSISNGERELWVPKSIVDDDSEVYAKGHVGTLVVPAWFARKNELG